MASIRGISSTSKFYRNQEVHRQQFNQTVRIVVGKEFNQNAAVRFTNNVRADILIYDLAILLYSLSLL